ncbi:MAG: alpha/beta hydrolase [Pseudomonadota bacterium]
MQVRTQHGRLLGWSETGPEGAPQALFLHPMLGRGGGWQGVWQHLPGRHLIAPDLPGHGRTDFDISQDLQEQAMIDALSVIDGPVDLVGHSFGGTVALRIAVAKPELVRSLTLIEPVYFVLLRDAMHPAYLDYLRQAQPLAGALARGDHDSAARAFIDTWGGVPAHEIPTRKWREIVARMPLVEQSQNATLNGAAPERLRLSDVARLAMPVQLIEGDRSPSVVSAIGDVLAENVPGLKRAQIADAGHMLAQSHSETVGAQIAAFWRGIADGRGTDAAVAA